MNSKSGSMDRTPAGAASPAAAALLDTDGEKAVYHRREYAYYEYH
jgi:hypothetical protein